MTLRWHPHAETYPLMEGKEREAFVASIKASNGNTEPVLYHIPDPATGEREYLDGRNRVSACEELGILFKDREVWPAELNRFPSIEEFIDARNLERRQLLDAGSRRARKSERVPRVHAMRAAGATYQAIANEEGVSLATVKADLETSSSGEELPETPPSDTITGADGKTYPAKRGKKNGQELFDWKAFDSAVATLMKAVDAWYRLLPRHQNSTEKETREAERERRVKAVLALQTSLKDHFDDLKIMGGAKAPRPTRNPLR